MHLFAFATMDHHDYLHVVCPTFVKAEQEFASYSTENPVKPAKQSEGYFLGNISIAIQILHCARYGHLKEGLPGVNCT